MSTARKTFSLGERFDRFIETQLAEGRFDNASEVVRAGLRLLEDHETRLKALRKEIAVGDADLDAGRVGVVDDVDAFVDDVARQGRGRLSHGN